VGRGRIRRLVILEVTALLSIVVEFVIVLELGQLLKVQPVAQDRANATKAAYELVALAGAVGDELELSAEVAVVLRQPLQEGHLVDDFHFLTGFLVHEEVTVLFLQLGGDQDNLRAAGSLQLPAGHVQVLVHDQDVRGTSV